MVCVLLAAGYATRLYPLTENKPKALLKLRETTILDMIMEKIEAIADISKVYIVTNHRYYLDFTDWASGYEGKKRIIVINDFSTSNDNRLGAIGDIEYAMQYEKINDDMLVMACDTVFGFDFTDFVDEYKQRKTDMICAYEAEDKSILSSLGVVELGEDNRVVGFEEKPENPKSALASAPCYLYKKETAELIRRYISDGNNADAPGYFVQWLIEKAPVYAYMSENVCVDIGTPEAYCDMAEQCK